MILSTLKSAHDHVTLVYAFWGPISTICPEVRSVGAGQEPRSTLQPSRHNHILWLGETFPSWFCLDISPSAWPTPSCKCWLHQGRCVGGVFAFVSFLVYTKRLTTLIVNMFPCWRGSRISSGSTSRTGHRLGLTKKGLHWV